MSKTTTGEAEVLRLRRSIRADWLKIRSSRRLTRSFEAPRRFAVPLARKREGPKEKGFTGLRYFVMRPVAPV